MLTVRGIGRVKNVGQSPAAHKHGSSTKEFKQVSQGGVKEDRSPARNHIPGSPYHVPFPSVLWHIHTYTMLYAYGPRHMCTYVNIIVIFFWLTTLKNVVHIDHIMCPIPVPASFPLPSPTLEFDALSLTLRATRFLY